MPENASFKGRSPPPSQGSPSPLPFTNRQLRPWLVTTTLMICLMFALIYFTQTVPFLAFSNVPNNILICHFLSIPLFFISPCFSFVFLILFLILIHFPSFFLFYIHSSSYPPWKQKEGYISHRWLLLHIANRIIARNAKIQMWIFQMLLVYHNLQMQQK